MGGMTYPDNDWTEAVLTEHSELSQMIDAIPFHCYAESWMTVDVEE